MSPGKITVRTSPSGWPCHPGSVRRLCLMEAIPIGEALARCDARFAAS
jgi:hypothetical protein